MDVLNSLESGDKYTLSVEGLPYAVELPFVRLPRSAEDGGGELTIASFNLVGQARLNRDLGKLLAARIRQAVGDLSGVVLFTVVEKGLQLAQVVADELDLPAMAVAYNRVKPHMEAARRPVLQIGSDSITSGTKFLAVYERDIALLRTARNGYILLDDVLSTGATINSLVEILEELVGRPTIRGVFCAATEGDEASRILRLPDPATPVLGLARLPDPTFTP